MSQAVYELMSIEELKKAIKRLERQIESKTKKHHALGLEIHNLRNDKLYWAKNHLRKKERAEFLAALFTAETRLEGVFDTRHRIVEIVRQLKSKDITVHMQEELRREKSQLIERLRNECTHALVIQFVGYPYHNSHEEPDWPERICLICGEAESGMFEPPPHKYKILQEALLETGDLLFVNSCKFEGALWVALKEVVKLVKDKV